MITNVGKVGRRTTRYGIRKLNERCDSRISSVNFLAPRVTPRGRGDRLQERGMMHEGRRHHIGTQFIGMITTRTAAYSLLLLPQTHGCP